MMNTLPTPSNAEIRERHEQDEADWENSESQAEGMRDDPDADWEVSHDALPESHNDRGELLDMIDATDKKLSDLQYRHECLKALYDAAVNCLPPHTVDDDIDGYILGERLWA